ncbi:hypothetical protein CASFOL_037987 [Castilleja foliolosa]|uniref:RBR-type E3 ubiquitin transferase n=1 Tax=Castilleja foliolosa TaxID=1961234 RepID=A0ABD3BKW4_9LAMI
MEAEQQNLALSCDDSYLSLLISADPHDQQDLELNPTALMSDDNFAQKLQLQEAIMSSLISNPIAPVVPHFTSNKMEIGSSSSYSHFPAIKTEIGESSTKQHLYMYCDICADRKNKKDFFPIQNCTHTFCNECISKHLSIKIEKGNIVGETFFPCPGIDCKGVLEMDTCRAILPKIVLSAWDEMICESMILESHKFYCPYKNCSGLLVNEGGIIREAECPYCHRLFCANCRAPWHSGIGCEEFLKLGENEREREDIMVHDLAKKNKWQRCPSCRFIVEKKEGCLHMTCVCGFQFCYACGKRWSSTHGGCQ